jgi:hypothetical protein
MTDPVVLIHHAGVPLFDEPSLLTVMPQNMTF